ncbi:membrane metalloprotease [Robertkochia marina]|uniref:Membrane metalloprotease n=1 Tax=Robertkochia marina TaxID=1227945 RepID=A0A4S3M452_9FLAO|nr:membrane metalloprotease [Robertkochia marina]THD69972.1 membrane metalloprotease [Robertkochia marina]
MFPKLKMRSWLFSFTLCLLLLAGCSPDGMDEDASFAANRLTTGISGKDLLTSTNFDRVFFEIVYVEGHEPSYGAIQNLLDFTKDRCFKPGGVNYSLTAIPDPGKSSLGIREIVDLEEQYREYYNRGNTITVFILVVNGRSARDEGNAVVLGTAYRNTSFVLFEETIRRFSEEFISNDKTVLESTVMNHEFSHLLGLVNLSTPMQSAHEDPDNPSHCETADCLMNYRTDAGLRLGALSFGGVVPSLDEQCLADLRALGGK